MTANERKSGKKMGPSDKAHFNEIGNQLKGNTSTDRPQMPPDWLQLDPEGVELIAGIINAAMATANAWPPVAIDYNLSDAFGTGLAIDFGFSRPDRFYIPGWHPSPGIRVVDLHKDLDSIYNGDPVADDVVAELSAPRHRRTLLTDFKLCPEAAEDILRERRVRDAICLRYMKILDEPTNWVGQVPADAEIYSVGSEPSGEVKS